MPLGLGFTLRERSSLDKDRHTHGEAFPTTLRRICRDGCVILVAARATSGA